LNFLCLLPASASCSLFSVKNRDGLVRFADSLISANKSKIYKTFFFLNVKKGGLIKSSSTQIIQTDYLLDHQYFDNDQQNMDKLDIINDFKKKTFDEIKCDLNKQTQYSVDKFNKVLDFIQNELSPQLSKKESPSCVNSSNSTINNLSMNSLSLITTPIMAHKPTIKDIGSPVGPIASPNSSKLVCLNDIQFPRSFIY
jgi:hypothetical protein